MRCISLAARLAALPILKNSPGGSPVRYKRRQPACCRSHRGVPRDNARLYRAWGGRRAILQPWPRRACC